MKENMSTQMDKLKAAQEKTLQKLHKAQEEESSTGMAEGIIRDYQRP